MYIDIIYVLCFVFRAGFEAKMFCFCLCNFHKARQVLVHYYHLSVLCVSLHLLLTNHLPCLFVVFPSHPLYLAIRLIPPVCRSTGIFFSIFLFSLSHEIAGSISVLFPTQFNNRFLQKKYF